MLNPKKSLAESFISLLFAILISNYYIQMEYKKKSLSNLDIKKDYEEIDTRLASGWYVDDINFPKKKIYKTKETSFKISKKLNT